jgi:hypothetical protein
MCNTLIFGSLTKENTKNSYRIKEEGKEAVGGKPSSFSGLVPLTAVLFSTVPGSPQPVV